MKNKYCRYRDLHNEADVEQSFVRRLLHDLGYSDEQIRPKDSLDRLTVGGMRGLPQSRYRPDFALRVDRKVRWIVEAKEPGADLDAHAWQPRAYAILLNGDQPSERPVRHYLLTNGAKTRLYHVDHNRPLLELNFPHFVDGNAKFDELCDLLKEERVVQVKTEGVGGLVMHRPSITEVNMAFSWCHQHIYKKDNISQSDAFSEFVKIISLKLLSDRRVRDAFPGSLDEEVFEVPQDRDVTPSFPPAGIRAGRLFRA